MNKIAGLIFDKDGTLFDFSATWEAWAAAFLRRICEDDPEKARVAGARIGFDVGTGRFASHSIAIAGTPRDIATALWPQFPQLPLEELEFIIIEEAEQAPQREAAPLRPLLSGWRARGLKLGVATNDGERAARAHLQQAGVTELFDFIAGYDSGFGGKPEPGQLFAFCEAMALAPDQVAMVGDSTHDLQAGRAAGMRTVAVLTGLAGRDDLRPLADVVLPDIGHIPAWLAG